MYYNNVQFVFFVFFPPSLKIWECIKTRGRTKGRVENWRSDLGLAYLFLSLSSDSASRASPCSISNSPSSNRTFSFPEYGFPIIFFHRLSQVASSGLSLVSCITQGSCKDIGSDMLYICSPFYTSFSGIS